MFIIIIILMTNLLFYQQANTNELWTNKSKFFKLKITIEIIISNLQINHREYKWLLCYVMLEREERNICCILKLWEKIWKSKEDNMLWNQDILIMQYQRHIKKNEVSFMQQKLLWSLVFIYS